MNVDNLKNGLVSSFKRVSILTEKHAPEIMLSVGLGGMFVSGVLACRATLKLYQVKEETDKPLEQIKLGKATGHKPSGDPYTNAEYRSDIATAYVQKSVAYARLYSVPILIAMASTGFILGSHNLLQKRNLALIAAYKILDEGYKNYRKRVVEEYGEEKDRMFRYGVREKTVVEKSFDENGKKIKTKKKEYDEPLCMKLGNESEYARWFDESCSMYRKNDELNMFFLKTQQTRANDMLNAQGHLFLNEVYDLLGLPRSEAGCVVGWVVGHGDGAVNFDLFNPVNEANRDFVNGYATAILLDFNVDGVIFDMI